MKKFVLAMLLMSLNTAFASKCDQQVLESYTKLYPENDYHSILVQEEVTNAQNYEFNSYGIDLSINYKTAISVYHASSEYQGGYGVEVLIVNSSTCDILEVHNVYME